MKLGFLEKLNDLEVNIGPLSIRGTQFILLGAVIVLVAGAGIAKTMIANQNAKAEAAQEAAKLEELKNSTGGIIALSLNDLQDGKYYIKDGDSFYALPEAILSSSEENDTLIPEKAHDGRLAKMNEAEAEIIPTLYNDTELIYFNASNTAVPDASGGSSVIPTSFWLERFKDQGYSLGVSRLTAVGSKYHFTLNDISSDSSISQSLTAEMGSDFVLDTIGGKNLSEDMLSPSGTITGLSKGQSYKVDIYSGTNYVGGEFIADTRYFTSYELYELTDYTLGTKGYVTIKMPSDYQNGYYYINGVGMFKFVNNSKRDGDTNANYSVPYYITDENGEVLKNAYDGTVKADGNSNSNSPSTKKENSWDFNISIDSQQAELNVTIVYEAAATKYSSSTSVSSAVLVNPNGETTDIANEEGNIMRAKVKNPIPGTWTVKLYGMENKTFKINTSFAGGSSNMLVKTTDQDAEMTVYVDKDLTDGIFIFDWTDKNHAGTFEIANGEKKFTNAEGKDVLTENYGHSEIKVGAIQKGEYKINVMGESLGNVKFSFKDAATDTNATPESSEVSDGSNAETSSVEENDKTKKSVKVTETESEAETEETYEVEETVVSGTAESTAA